MDADRIVRVRYFDRQFLRPQDFTDEQTYHVAMRRRHNIAGHSWGILHGLALTATAARLPCNQAWPSTATAGRWW